MRLNPQRSNIKSKIHLPFLLILLNQHLMQYTRGQVKHLIDQSPEQNYKHVINNFLRHYKFRVTESFIKASLNMPYMKVNDPKDKTVKWHVLDWNDYLIHLWVNIITGKSFPEFTTYKCWASTLKSSSLPSFTSLICWQHQLNVKKNTHSNVHNHWHLNLKKCDQIWRHTHIESTQLTNILMM